MGRGLASVAVRLGGEVLLFDCGEGTQRQMMRARVGFKRRMKIFITHLHGDHLLGLPGLLQTMSLLDRREKVEIYGPVGVGAFLAGVSATVRGNLAFPVGVEEVEEGAVCRGRGYRVVAGWAEHSTPTLAYALIEDDKPGKFHPERAEALGVPKGPLWHRLQHGRRVKLKDGRVVEPSEVVEPKRRGVRVVYSGDTRPCRGVVKLAEGADLLIHEATFDDELTERAEADWHSTASQAAQVAAEAGVRMLVLTHISARYKDPTLLLSQARRVFGEVAVAEDLMAITL